MRTKLMVVALVALTVALSWWRHGGRTVDASRAGQSQKPVATAATAKVSAQPLLSLAKAGPRAATPVSVPDAEFPLRLRNTAKPIGELIRDNRAILLENALIDSRVPGGVAVPQRLKSAGAPGAYIVQARSKIDLAFKRQIEAAGGVVVSYIPNNAYLVKMDDAGYQRLAANAAVQSVYAYEPYYKLDSYLLTSLTAESIAPKQETVRVTLFAGGEQAGVDAIQQANGQVVGRDRSPFGPELIAQISSKDLVTLAQSSTVQAIARQGKFRYMNDLARERVRVSADTRAITPNYLGLSGANVYVNVNDSGVDAYHPDLIGRVLPDGLYTFASTNDTAGHGTHVAGTIASSGASSPTGVPGSVTGADFRGMASQASILSLRADGYVNNFSMADLFETAARSNRFVFNLTNALISNNSWGFDEDFVYSSYAAAADAAVRDAIPGVSGEQPMVLVFAAGNSGFAHNDDGGGFQGSVVSPGTAKNVITVGALESYRAITNTFIDFDGSISSYFVNSTDSSNEVRSSSSRGNVSAGIEGSYGRFKPDVVAPGTMMVSTRSTQWDQAAYYNITNSDTTTYTDITVAANSLFQNAIYIPGTAVGFSVTASQTSPSTPLNLLIYTNTVFNPSTNAANLAGINSFSSTNGDAYFTPGVFLYYDIVNTNDVDIIFTIDETMVTTNSNGNYLTALSNLNQTLAPNYRYESGTSMAAPVVSGMLALMQELFEQQLGLTNSPAMMKALLINGAVSQSPLYDIQVQNFINHQGWGLPSLSNSISKVMQLNPTDNTVWPMRLYDQSTNRFLSTGVEHDYAVTLPSTSSLEGGGSVDATNYPLRVTLVWTDPPGNPIAGIKLVNDLDLVVTNLDSGEVFYGNAFLGGSTYVSATNVSGASSNDVVNNVENVFLPPGAGRNFTVAVRGTRVNVNAVTADTNSIAQDYALVITVGEPRLQSGLTVAGPTLTTNNTSRITYLATGGSAQPLLSQRVGANASVLTSTNGATNQWVFYVVTNTTASTNVAFVTFLPPNLSSSRNSSADLDLFVSFDPNLTNLVGSVIGAAYKSVSRGGTEAITFTNSTVGTVYYVGVKSEDQMAADFGFFAASTDDPFSRRNADGSVDVFGIALSADIPDGNNAAPGLVQIFFVNTETIPIRRVVVTNTFTHQRPGDLEFLLEHDTTNTVLKLHDEFLASGAATYTVIYDDSSQGDITNSVPPDYPGSLQKFVGGDGIGAWILSVADYGEGYTGTVDAATIHIDQQSITNDSGGTGLTNNATSFFYDFVDVPSGAVSLSINAANILPANAPLQIFLRKGAAPTLTTYDLTTTVTNTGGSLTITIYDSPPLQPGRYYVGFYNPNSVTVTATISYSITYDTTYVADVSVTSGSAVTILDDAKTSVSTYISTNWPVAGVEVGVRIDHPRASDLTLRLVSPNGTRVLLAENRGGQSTLGYGTNASPGPYSLTTFVTDTNLTTLPIKFDVPPFLGNSVTVGSGLTLVSSNFFNGVSNNFGYGIGTISNRLYIVGTTNPATGLGQDGLIMQIGMPMTNTAAIVWKTNFPAAANDDQFYGMAVTTSGVFAVGDSYSQTTDTSAKTTKGITVKYPLLGATGATASGSTWVRQTPAAAAYGTTTTETNFAVTASVESGTEYVYVAGYTTHNFGGGPNRDHLVLTKINGSSGTISWTSSDTNAGGNLSYGYAVATMTTNVFVAGSAGASAANQFPCIKKYQTNSVEGTFSSSGLKYILYANKGAFYGMTIYGTNIIVVGEDTSGGGASVALIASYTENGTLNWSQTYSAGTGTNAVFRSVVALNNRLYAVGSSADNTGTDDDVLIVDFDPTTGVAGTATTYGGSGSFVGNSALTDSGDLYVGGYAKPTGTNTGVMLLRFSLGSAQNAVLPEEPLDAFIGEYSGGNWTLEIVDNRAGPTSATVPKLLEWNLTLYLAATNASTLTLPWNTPVTLTVYTNQTYFFMVDVPFNASFATNTLTSVTGGQLDLVFNQTFLPDGTHAGDFTLLNNVTAGSSTLNKTTSSPLLQSGTRYYLGVKNQNTAETNTFTLRVDFNTTNLTTLNEFHTIFGSLLPTAQPEKFYQIQVPAGVTAVLFELSGLTGSADMFVAKGRLPSATDYEYLGTAPISTARRVYVKQSVDFPDISGTWYIGVRNNEATSINYYFNISFPIDGDVIPTIIPLTMGTTPSVTAGGDVNVGFIGLSGETYLVEYTTDFVTWTTLKYVTAVTDSVQFTDTPTGAELRFYRVSQVPTPTP